MSELAILGISAGILLLAGLWPFGPYQLSLLAARRLGRFPAAPATQGSGSETFAVCLCAYNEAAVIEQKLADLLRLRAAAGGELQILVYVDAATDGTAEIARRYADRIELIVSTERRGKTFGMNQLVLRARASVVIFTDANVLVDPSAIAVLRRYFADPGVGCVCSDLTYVNAAGSATATVGSRYWRLNEWTKGLESATGSVIGADGSLFAIRRELHEPVPKGLFDDLYVSLVVLLRGYRVVRAPEFKAYETHTTQPGDEFRRKIRIGCECMHVHLTLWPRLRALDAWTLSKYLAHRLMRWLSGYLLGLSALFTLVALALAVGPLPVALALAIAAVAFSICCHMHLRAALLAWNAALAFVGTGIGVWQALRGRRAVTWDAAETTRQMPVVQ